ncbi:MAG: hypothetical protein ACT4PE_18280 [Candidatus Eiseniibacteriota bacterium]
MRVLALIFALLSVRPALADGERQTYSGEVGDLVLSAIATHNASSAFPLPELDGEKLDQLLAGEVVRMRWKQPVTGEGGEVEPKERHRVVALYLIEQPRVNVWLSAMDPHFIASERVIEVRIDDDGRGRSTWYQHMDLPWPVENRHWVIDVRKTPDMHRATGGLVWEQPWYLVEDGQRVAEELAASGRTPGLSLGDVKDAVYLQANTGTWAMFALSPDLTLLTYQVTVVMGGLLPEGLTARFASRELQSLCHIVERNARTIPEHYAEGHDPVMGGDGQYVTPGHLAP